MIDPTDEMVKAFKRVWRERYQFGSSTQADATRAGLAAVLALVERDYGMVGPCSSALPHLADPEIAEFCELRHGHSGDHECGPTRWRELP